MSRRPPNPAAERAARNQQTIKGLLKLEANKICADCKKNKHPRWASWNLGVFVCIRCSGIHRGMGTHISRVKSVDLDSWTDEQLQSILSWGNARANKYWEAKLAAGHVPSEAKIENFIRTKYELKRWVMDGPMPDPATLDADGDDDIPLSIVKEKQSIDKNEAVRKASVGQSSAPAAQVQQRVPAPPPAPAIDLFGDDPVPLRASTGPQISHVPPKSSPAPPKTTSANNSLLNLDLFGPEPMAPPRPSSTTGATGGMGGGMSRPDLRQSILSLYATAPAAAAATARPQQPYQTQQSVPLSSFGAMSSPSLPQQQQQQQQSSMMGINDAFSSLSFGTPAATAKSPPAAPPTQDAFAALRSMSTVSRSPPVPAPQSSATNFPALSGGSFFDAKPAAAPSLSHHQQKASFGALVSPGISAPAPKPAAAAPVPASAPLDDIFDFVTPAAAKPAAAAAPQPSSTSASSFLSGFASTPTAAAPAAPAATNSIFNLSASAQPKSPPPGTTTTPAAAPALNPMASMSASGWASSSDVWGDSNAWSTPDNNNNNNNNNNNHNNKAATQASRPAAAAATTSSTTSAFGGWGGTSGSLASQPIVPGASGGFAPKVAADEEFGGWASSTGTGGAGAGGATKPVGGGGGFGAGSDDLFSNVWQ